MKNYFIAILVTAIALTAGVVIFDRINPLTDVWPLIIAIVVYSAMSLFSFNALCNAFTNPNPNVLMRAKLTTTMVKFFISIGLFLSYIFIKHKVNVKPTIWIFLAIYGAYAIVEAVFLSRKASQKA